MLLIELNDISYILDRKPIIQRISFSIHAGQFITLIGPNGAGKTTLLRLIIGLLRPTLGQIKHIPHLNIGYVPQKIKVNQLMPLQVKTFLELCIPRENQDRIYQELGIIKLLNESIHHLSGGELQRVLLAQAIGKFTTTKSNFNNDEKCTLPELLILDEPTQGMDTSNQVALFKLLTYYNQNYGMTILMVSHDLHFVHQASSHVICINQHICCQGKPQEIYQMPAYRNLFPDFNTVFSPYHHHHSHDHDRINIALSNFKDPQ